MVSSAEEPQLFIEDLIAIAQVDRPVTIEVTGLDIFTKRLPGGGIKQLLVMLVSSPMLGQLRANMRLPADGPNFHVTLFER